MLKFIAAALLFSLLAFLLLLSLIFLRSLETLNWYRKTFIENTSPIELKSYALSQIHIPALTIQSDAPLRKFTGTLKASYENEHISIDLSEALLSQSGFLFENLTASGRLGLQSGIHTSPNIQLNADRVIAGLPFTQIKAQLTMRNNALSLKNVQASVFGGTIELPAIQITSMMEQSQKLLLKVKNINLKEMTALLGQDDLQVTGTVSGTLPGRLTPEGLFLENGQLSTDEGGGTIRYADDGQSSGLTALVRKALSNYHYRTLEAEISGEPNGKLLISAHLKGSNPDLNKGQEVHVNLNIEQNVLSLLRSLRAKQEIEDRIEKAFQVNQ